MHNRLDQAACKDHPNPDADRYQIRCLWCTWTDIASTYCMASASANAHFTNAHGTLIRCPACGARLPAVMVTDRDCVLCRLEAA